jgi:hypothetical protein
MSIRSEHMQPAGAALAAVLAASILASVGATANADPAVRQVAMNCDDGSTFTAEFNHPDESAGLAQTFKIVPGTGTGAASDAVAFTWHLRTVTAPDGSVVHSDSAGSGVAQRHSLITCSAPAFRNPDFTLHLTGFLVPANESVH